MDLMTVLTIRYCIKGVKKHNKLHFQDPFLIVWGASHDPAPIGHKLPILTTAYGHVEIPLIITLFLLFMGILKVSLLAILKSCRHFVNSEIINDPVD